MWKTHLEILPHTEKLWKKIGKNHRLALELWQTGIHDARLLAFLIDEPEKVTKTQMNKWAKDFNSWDITDGRCFHLFVDTPFAYDKVFEWSKRKEQFLKRAAFVLMTVIAVHHKDRPDKDFLKFFPVVKKESIDGRNFVKKAVNWALRQIGKRSKYLHKEAVKLAGEIKKLNSKSARWIANDALRELKNPKLKLLM